MHAGAARPYAIDRISDCGGGGGSYLAASGILESTAYNRFGDGYVRIAFIDRIAPPPPLPMPGVPEPSIWAMLIIGFGLCGLAMSERQAKAHAFRTVIE